jgi:hypothetical protein
MPWDDQVAKQDAERRFVEGAKDVGMSVKSGIERGAAKLPGLPVDLVRGGLSAYNWARRRFMTGETAEEQAARIKREGGHMPEEFMPGYAGEDWLQSARETSVGGVPMVSPDVDYKPQTTAGSYAQLGGEIAGSGGINPRNIARVAARAGPGIVERIGAAVAKTGEDVARNVAAPVAGVAAGENAPIKLSDDDRGAVATILGFLTGTAGQAGSQRGTGRAVVGGRIGGTAEDAADAAAQFHTMGPSGMVADIQPGPARLAGSLVSMPGEPGRQVSRAIAERLDSRSQRMRDELDRRIGPTAPNFEEATQQRFAQRNKEGDVNYEEARQVGRPVDTQPALAEIAQTLQRYGQPTPGRTALPFEQTIARVSDMIGSATDVDTLHHVKVAIDGIIKDGDRNTQRILRPVQDKLVKAMDDATVRLDPNAQPVLKPDGSPSSAYQDARENWKSHSDFLDARERGLTLFTSEKETPGQLALDLKTMTPEQREGLVEGVRQNINRVMDRAKHEESAGIRTLDTRDATAKMLELEKAKALPFGTTNAVVRMLEGQQREAQSASRISGGSPTAERLAGQKELEAPKVGKIPEISTNPIDVLNRIAQPAVNVLYGGQVKAAQEEISQALRSGQNLSAAERAALVEELQRTYARGGDPRMPPSLRASIAATIANRDRGE